VATEIQEHSESYLFSVEFNCLPCFFLIIQLLLVSENYGFFVTLCNQK